MTLKLCKLAAAVATTMAVSMGSAHAGIVVNEWTLDLSSFGLGKVTNINQLTFNGLFNSTAESDGDGVLEIGDTGGVNGLISITSFLTSGTPSLKSFTDNGSVLGLDFEITASFSLGTRLTSVTPDGLGGFNSSFIHQNTAGYDGLLEIWVDTTPNANTNPDVATSGTGFEDGIKIAVFKLEYANGGGTFNTRTIDGGDDVELVLQGPPLIGGVLLDQFGNDLEAGTLLGIADSNTDADSDNNGIRDTTVPGAPGWFGTCTNTITSNCGTEDGSFALAVPEPGSIALIGLGLFGLAGSLQRRRKV